MRIRRQIAALANSLKSNATAGRQIEYSRTHKSCDESYGKNCAADEGTTSVVTPSGQAKLILEQKGEDSYIVTAGSMNEIFDKARLMLKKDGNKRPKIEELPPVVKL